MTQANVQPKLLTVAVASAEPLQVAVDDNNEIRIRLLVEGNCGCSSVKPGSYIDSQPST